MRYFECEKCGNVVELVRDGKKAMWCCEEQMKELNPNTKEASHEKHIPVVEKKGDKVTVHVAEAEHPMIEEHYIGWVSICTDSGTQRKPLYINKEPKASFMLSKGEKLREAYAFCNLHGLWRKEISED